MSDNEKGFFPDLSEEEMREMPFPPKSAEEIKREVSRASIWKMMRFISKETGIGMWDLLWGVNYLSRMTKKSRRNILIDHVTYILHRSTDRRSFESWEE